MDCDPLLTARTHAPRTGHPSGRSRRGGVLSRVLAAILGGYALAVSFSCALALLVRSPREEAALVGSLPAYLLFVAAILWSFAARTALKAWLGILLPTLLLTTLALWLFQAPKP